MPIRPEEHLASQQTLPRPLLDRARDPKYCVGGFGAEGAMKLQEVDRHDSGRRREVDRIGYAQSRNDLVQYGGCATPTDLAMRHAALADEGNQQLHPRRIDPPDRRTVQYGLEGRTAEDILAEEQFREWCSSGKTRRRPARRTAAVEQGPVRQNSVVSWRSSANIKCATVRDYRRPAATSGVPSTESATCTHSYLPQAGLTPSKRLAETANADHLHRR